MSNYIHTPKTINYKDIVQCNFGLSSSQHKKIEVTNQNYKLVKEFLARDLTRKDLGREVGSENYIEQSKYFFLRTKALQDHSYIPEITPETALPIKPSSFVKMNLKKGNLIISKDGNIGEIVILDRDYPNIMLSGALYKLPINKDKYYLLALMKHAFFREQLDFIVPKGATIRHAKTLFLDCKIPIPNDNTDDVVKFVESLTQAIVNKQRLIKERHQAILSLIEKELLNNQKNNNFSFNLPTIKEIESIGRLDTSLYLHKFQKWDYIVKNYINGYIDLISRGFSWSRGTSLEKNFIGSRINSNKPQKGFYELVLPTNISQYGYVEKSTYIGTPTKLKTIKQGDIIFGGEGFGKGRTYVVVDESNNVATNYHGIRIINDNKNLIESIFIRCFLAFWREKGMIDAIGVGSSGGHCSPSYFNLINTPNFPTEKQEEIAKLYHNPIVYDIKNATIDNFITLDSKFNNQAGIYELDKTAKDLQILLDKAIENIINDKNVTTNFSIG